jgi:hypothetical protein
LCLFYSDHRPHVILTCLHMLFSNVEITCGRN